MRKQLELLFSLLALILAQTTANEAVLQTIPPGVDIPTDLILNSTLASSVEIFQPFDVRFTFPVDLQNDGFSHFIYVVEQVGTIRMFSRENATQVFWFLDIQDRVVFGGERGLVGLAFDPEYETNSFFYVCYTNPDIVISRFTALNATIADPNSEFKIISWKHPFENHNAGQLAFGPDGFLYIATGDGGSAGDPLRNAQNTKSLLGKMLRIDVRVSTGGTETGTIGTTTFPGDTSAPAGTPPSGQNPGTTQPLNVSVTGFNPEVRSIFSNYSIPQDNPFLNNSNYLPEIWALGLRNPFRFSFDPDTGSIWLGDSGQNMWEEIDIMLPGQNYGWPNLEGPACYYPPRGCQSFGTLPVFAFNHTTAPFAMRPLVVIGGHVYRGMLSRALQGMYIFAESISGTVWALSTNTTMGRASSSTAGADLIATLGRQISSFGVDVDNELYFLNYQDGYVYGIRDLSAALGSEGGLGTASEGSAPAESGTASEGSAPAESGNAESVGSEGSAESAESETATEGESGTASSAESGPTRTGTVPTEGVVPSY